MSQATISGTVRETFGTKASNAARAQGQIPLTISRPGQDSLHITVAEKDAEIVAHHNTKKFTIQVNGADTDVVLKDVKRHVLNDRIQHIDLIGVSDDSEVVVNIPVKPLAQNCPGLKEGGLLEQSLRKVKIKCQVKDIPDHLDVDLSNVGVGQTVYVGSCSIPEGARFITKPNVAMISILMTRSMKKDEQEADGEGAAAAPAAAAE